MTISLRDFVRQQRSGVPLNQMEIMLLNVDYAIEWILCNRMEIMQLNGDYPIE